MRLGSIYLITDKANGKQYVGQTARDVETRFLEHCSERRGHSKLHEAIQEKGWQNFEWRVIEQVPLDKLDERERYWIKELNTRENGYNIAVGGKDTIFTEWPRVQVAENDLVFDSKEDMARIFNKVTSWSINFLRSRFKRAIANNEELFGYHFIQVASSTIPSDPDVLEDWIKTLNIQFQGKHIYCYEIDKEFDTIAEAAKYFLDNGLYVTQSRTPLQSLVTSIGKVVNGKTEYIQGVNEQYTFDKVPGSTKQKGGKDFSKKKVYCPQIDKTFESQVEAAHYFIDNKIWTGIVFKTAKLRISDVVRGAFPDYRGYTFVTV